MSQPKFKKGDQVVFANIKLEILDILVDSSEYLIEVIASKYLKGQRRGIPFDKVEQHYSLYTGPRDTPTPPVRSAAVYDSLTTVPTQQSCNHDFKMYYGFSQNYEYCKKCDFKKR